MRLYEFEGKELLKKHGVPVPESLMVSDVTAASTAISGNLLQSWGGCAVKAQVLSGLRGKHGGVRLCRTLEEAKACPTMLGSLFNNETVNSLLIEQLIPIRHQYYASFMFDTDARSAVMVLSAQGGIAIEDEVKSGTGTLVRLPIDPLLGLQEWTIREAAAEIRLTKEQTAMITPVLLSLYRCFEQEDAVQVEVNPLAEDDQGNFIALDAKIELCDDGGYKHKGRQYPPRVAGFSRPPTAREQLVKEINAKDYRGTVKYLELDGDIAFLASSGGGSITCMDALATCDGKPSNYTEFSGNPPTEKVYELTKAVLSKPGLIGLWIVGPIANFTNVETTITGIVDALKEIRPAYPIVVRRSGPKEAEGLQLLQELAATHHLDIETHGAEMPMTRTAQIIVQKSRQFKEHMAGMQEGHHGHSC